MMVPKERRRALFLVPFFHHEICQCRHGPGGGDQIQASISTSKSYYIYIVRQVLLLLILKPPLRYHLFRIHQPPTIQADTQDDSRKAARNRKPDPLWIVSCLIDSYYSSVLYSLVG